MAHYIEKGGTLFVKMPNGTLKEAGRFRRAHYVGKRLTAHLFGWGDIGLRTRHKRK